MSRDPGSDVKKSMEQRNEDLSKFMGQLSVTADNSRKSSPSLSDMPVDVVSLIIERSKYREQLKLRKVSKSLRALVDKQKPACKSIQFVFSKEGIGIKMDNFHVTYAASYFDCDVFPVRDDDILIISDNYRQIAFADFLFPLKNPRLQLDELIINFACYDEEDREMKAYIMTNYNILQYALEPLKRQLLVKKVELDVLSPSNLLSILPYLKPGFLENISIWLRDEIDLTGMDQVALLEQWKQAVELELYHSFYGFSLEHATHFKRFRIIEDEMDGDMITRIKDLFSKSANFEHCILSCWEFSDDPDSVHELLGSPVSSNATEEVFHQPIPDSDYYFEFKWATNSADVEVEKKKREKK